MGNITRKFANNILTGGFISPSAVTNDSLTNFTSAPGGLSAPGYWNLISSATASADATIDFSFSGSYDEYVFAFLNLRPSQTTEADALFNFSTDSGSNYNTAITSTSYRHISSSSQGLQQYYTGTDLAQGTTGQYFGFDMEDDDTNSVIGGFLHVWDVHSTTTVKQFYCETTFSHDADRNDHYIIGGYVNTTSALTNIRFFRDTGNYTDGTIGFYGIT